MTRTTTNDPAAGKEAEAKLAELQATINKLRDSATEIGMAGGNIARQVVSLCTLMMQAIKSPDSVGPGHLLDSLDILWGLALDGEALIHSEMESIGLGDVWIEKDRRREAFEKGLHRMVRNCGESAPANLSIAGAPR